MLGTPDHRPLGKWEEHPQNRAVSGTGVKVRKMDDPDHSRTGKYEEYHQSRAVSCTGVKVSKKADLKKVTRGAEASPVQESAGCISVWEPIAVT